jgi:ABC-type uncharacterized transport system auxiliary subunit
MRFLLIVVVVPWLVGCSSILTSDQPADQIYWLEPADLSAEFDAPAQALGVRVTISVVPGLDTDRILIKGPGPTLNQYAGARWPDNLPEIMWSLLGRTMESSGLFTRTESSSEAELKLEVREFFAVANDTGSSPTISVSVQGQLTCERTAGSEVLGSQVSQTASANRLSAIVVAHQSALDDVMRDLVLRIRERCFGK